METAFDMLWPLITNSVLLYPHNKDINTYYRSLTISRKVSMVIDILGCENDIFEVVTSFL